MTQNVRNTIRSRCGNALACIVVNGIASAAARDTAPRIPAQATTCATADGGGGLFASNEPRNRFGKYVNTGTNTSRVTDHGAGDEHPPPDELRRRVAR